MEFNNTSEFFQKETSYLLNSNTKVFFKTQLFVFSLGGSLSFILFCILRYKWPNIYAVRLLGNSCEISLRTLPKSFFGWIVVVYSITEKEILENSGLDIYVFLEFFKMGCKIFFCLSLISIFILNPIYFYFSNNDTLDFFNLSSIFKILKFDLKSIFFLRKHNHMLYCLFYFGFTYLFSIIVYLILFDTSKKVLKTRQRYLGYQNSITDRTLKLEGIPGVLLKDNDPQTLKNFIENLGIGKVTDIKFVYDYSLLENIYKQRRKVIHELELQYASHYGLQVDIYNRKKNPSVYLKNFCFPSYQSCNNEMSFKFRSLISNLSKTLFDLDNKIKIIRNEYECLTSKYSQKTKTSNKIHCAFITMDSVASAQMAAQTILDPRVYKLIASLAPAPNEIIWRNFKFSDKEKAIKSNIITFITILTSGFIVFLVTPLTALLNLKTITRVFPNLGIHITKSKWLTNIITYILPPMIVTFFNFLFPYFYSYLSECQGLSTKSEIELSTFLKNFFFIFFNLFLVFVATGTIWDYFLYISDTTKIAYQLASSLKKMSLFYVELILLQGLLMFPIKMLQISNFLILNIIGKLLFLKNIFFKTPKNYRSYYYTPQNFNFGIHLPQHIFIFIIVLIYSVVSTKIITSGLLYFACGYFVYKYQLIYTYVHLSHSTGKIWPMIFRRLMFGLIIFQLFMCGTLALEKVILLSALCFPLIIITCLLIWKFEKNYLPLYNFIALKAIKNNVFYDCNKTLTQKKNFDLNTENLTNDKISNLNESSTLLPQNHLIENYSLPKRKKTIEEERVKFSYYVHPFLTKSLNGPCIGFDGDFIHFVEYYQSNLNPQNSNKLFTHQLHFIYEKIIKKKIPINDSDEYSY